MTALRLPPATTLTGRQYAGWDCVYCRAPLTNGGASAGISRGRMGAHVLDVEVYACTACLPESPPQTPARSGS